MPARILGVGIVTLDVVNVVDHYPDEDQELRALSQSIVRGGNSANTLCVLSQFKHECYWIGTLANDIHSQFILADFLKNKIDVSLCKKVDQGTQPTSYITLNQSNGSRSIIHYRDLPELDFSHFKSQLTTNNLQTFDWIHFEARAIEETLLMIKYVKSVAPEIKVSIEIEKPRDNLDNLFDLADLYFYSKSYAVYNSFTQAKEFLEQQQKFSPDADLVCSWGKQGAYALLANNTFITSSAFSPDKVVDTIGAGDTFNAALIHNRILNNSWPSALENACRIAGKKCGQFGFDNLTGNIDML